VLDDPFAIPLLGDRALESVDEHGPQERFGARFLVTARARLAEDLLAQAVARGVTRYVVLGAGLDTFALRNPHPGLEVVEVDHPATQAFKRERYAAAKLAVPPSLTFLAVDFETDDLAARLAELGPSPATFCSWLGVSYYLPLPAIRATLAAVARCAPASELVLDHYLPPGALPPDDAARLTALSARVAALGEPFVSLLTPEALRSELALAGFTSVDTPTPRELAQRYLGAAVPPGAGFAGYAHARRG
jgi:methyltransferase (TIGR00027 family)